MPVSDEHVERVVANVRRRIEEVWHVDMSKYKTSGIMLDRGRIEYLSFISDTGAAIRLDDVSFHFDRYDNLSFIQWRDIRFVYDVAPIFRGY